MSIIELKKVCHVLLDQVEDKKLLEEFLEVLKNRNNDKNIDFWNELSEEQKKDLEEAWLESEDENNLISHEEVMKQAQEWLKR